MCVGKCPKCGGSVYKGKKQGSYYCGNKECNFIMTQFRKKPLTEKQAAAVLEGKKVLIKNLEGGKGKYDIYIQKNGLKKFSVGDKDYWGIDYMTSFPEKF